MKFSITMKQTRSAVVEVEAENYLEATDRASMLAKNNAVQWENGSLNFTKCLVAGKPLYHWISESEKTGRNLEDLILEASSLKPALDRVVKSCEEASKKKDAVVDVSRDEGER